MIYKITNTKNGDFYIGYTSKTMETRFERHIRNIKSKEKRYNTYLYRAMRKYGIESFTVECIKPDGTLDDEVHFISELKPTYNMAVGGSGGDMSHLESYRKGYMEAHKKRKPEEFATYGFMGKKHTKETIDKMKSSQKQMWENYNEEDKKKRAEKISGKNNGMYGKVPSNAIPVIVDGISFPSKAAASRYKREQRNSKSDK